MHAYGDGIILYYQTRFYIWRVSHNRAGTTSGSCNLGTVLCSAPDLLTSEQQNYRKNPGTGFTSFKVNLKAVYKYSYSTDKINTNFQIFPIPHPAQALAVSKFLSILTDMNVPILGWGTTV